MVPSTSPSLRCCWTQEYVWSFSVQYELIAFRGVGASPLGHSETLQISVPYGILEVQKPTTGSSSGAAVGRLRASAAAV